MPTLRLSIGLLLLVGLSACSRTFWERPRVAGQMQPSPSVAAPQPQPRYAAPPGSALPPPQTRPSQASPPGYAQPAPMQVPMASPGGTRGEEQLILQHVNQIRRSQGLPQLTWNETLYACARGHSEEQCRCGYMGHQSPDPARRTLVQRMHLAGYQGQMYGEVVAWGYDDAQSVVEGWMNSREHRAILMDREMKEAAFSRVGQYWTGNFGTPRIAPPARYGPPSTPSSTGYAPTAPAPSYAPTAPAPTYAPAMRSPTVRSAPTPTARGFTPPPPSAAVPSYRPPAPRQPVQQYFAPVQPGPRPAPTYRPPARGG